MKLYAAMVVGIALGAGLAVFLAARDLEDDAPTTSSIPAAPPAPPTVAGTTMGA